MKKRILPALLALCMVVSLLPMTVFAAKPEGCMEGCVEGKPAQGTEGQEGYVPAVEEKHVAGCSTKCTKALDCPNLQVEGGKHKDNCLGKAAADAEAAATCSCGCKYADCDKCSKEGDTETCGCATDPCGEAGCKFVKCTNEQCKDLNKVVEKPHTHTVPTACAANQNNSGVKNCTNSTHQDDCPDKCDFGTCNKTAGHDGAHSDTATCSGDEHCGVAAAVEGDIVKHQDGCTKLAAALEDGTITLTGKDIYVYETEVEASVTCACSEAKHPDHNGEATATCSETKTAKLPVKVNIVYTKATADEIGAGTTDEDKIDDAVTAAADAIGTAKDAVKDAWETENASWICDKCKAQLTGACNMHADCEAAEHLKDCLSQCTLGANCPNSVGVSTAHRVQYTVVEKGKVVGTYNVRADAEAHFDQLYKTEAAKVETARKAFVAAQAGNDDAATATAKTNYDNAVKAWNAYTLIVEAIHCPKAGVPNGTVIAVDEAGEVVEKPEDNTTTDTPKAPEKAADFEDLKGDEWYAEELTEALEKGFFKGSLDAGKYSFKATDKMNTSTLVVLVSRVLDKGFKTEGADWDKEAVAWATEDGLTEGVEAGEVVRKDVVLVLWRAAGKPASEQDVSAFTDLADLEGDELTAMKWAVEKEIIKGDAGETKTARPADAITRAEMVAVINRFDGVVNK